MKRSHISQTWKEVIKVASGIGLVLIVAVLVILAGFNPLLFLKILTFFLLTAVVLFVIVMLYLIGYYTVEDWLK